MSTSLIARISKVSFTPHGSTAVVIADPILKQSPLGQLPDGYSTETAEQVQGYMNSYLGFDPQGLHPPPFILYMFSIGIRNLFSLNLLLLFR